MNTLYVGIDVSSKSNVVYLMLPNGDKHSNFYIKNIEDEIEKLELEINSQNFQDKDTIKRWQLYKNRLDKSIGDGE